MKVLILGGAGMLGHQVAWALRNRHQIFVTFRGAIPDCGPYSLDVPAFPRTLLEGLDATHPRFVERTLELAEPDAVVNCIGMVKQRKTIEPIEALEVNSVLPHRLARACQAKGIRFIHISTDCVFSGNRGHYTESCLPDPPDFYGRSKLLGEPEAKSTLVIRTSLVGWELTNSTSLLEWFAAQKGKTIPGYTGAIFSGLPTYLLAALIARILEKHSDLDGLFHVATDPISKFDLLVRLRDSLGWTSTAIIPDNSVHCNRSLSGRKFSDATSWLAPSWDEMTDELARERPQYESWRNRC